LYRKAGFLFRLVDPHQAGGLPARLLGEYYARCGGDLHAQNPSASSNAVVIGTITTIGNRMMSLRAWDLMRLA
jgi:hypothetical protein